MRRAVCLSSLRSWLASVSVYSIVQAKGISHVFVGIHLFRALTKALQGVRGQVVVLHVFKAALDQLTQLESLDASGLHGLKIEPLLGFGIKSNRSRHVAGS